MASTPRLRCCPSYSIAQTNGRELEAMPEQVRLPPPPKVLRDRPQFEG